MWARNTFEIGKIIRTARLRQKLSQAELARLLGTTQAWISEVEKGKETAQIGMILRALTHLGIRLRTDEATQDAKESHSPAEKGVDLDKLIKSLSQPARASKAGK